MVAQERFRDDKIRVLSIFKNDIAFKRFLNLVYNVEKFTWYINKLPRDYKPLDEKMHIDLTPMHLRRNCHRLELLAIQFQTNGTYLSKERKDKELYLFLENLHADEVGLVKQMIEKRQIKGVPKDVVLEVFPDLFEVVL